MSGKVAEFGGSLTAEVPEVHPNVTHMLHIRMTRGERHVADELSKMFGGFERVIIDVDGEEHEFNADSLIQLLESYEGATRYHELFGTPEKAARTLESYCFNTPSCTDCSIGCKGRSFQDYDNIIEWLRGDA